MKMKNCQQCDAVHPGFYMKYFLTDTVSIELGKPELNYPLFSDRDTEKAPLHMGLSEDTSRLFI